mmetsp:Transcript_2729/g.6205  ORF Transcript_2729/g.6205 Transcript_2729/m.6205 type:complete len:206 (+) Transcript_2729:558-1175(+)
MLSPSLDAIIMSVRLYCVHMHPPAPRAVLCVSGCSLWVSMCPCVLHGSFDPAVLAGHPVVRGPRFSVSVVATMVEVNATAALDDFALDLYEDGLDRVGRPPPRRRQQLHADAATHRDVTRVEDKSRSYDANERRGEGEVAREEHVHHHCSLLLGFLCEGEQVFLEWGVVGEAVGRELDLPVVHVLTHQRDLEPCRRLAAILVFGQ